MRNRQSPHAISFTWPNNYTLVSNITYMTASNYEAKLDIYQPRGLKVPNPLLLYFHGGGWTRGTKEGSLFTLLPYLQLGWTVVNMEYRLVNGRLRRRRSRTPVVPCDGRIGTPKSTISARPRS